MQHAARWHMKFDDYRVCTAAGRNRLVSWWVTWAVLVVFGAGLVVFAVYQATIGNVALSSTALLMALGGGLGATVGDRIYLRHNFTRQKLGGEAIVLHAHAGGIDVTSASGSSQINWMAIERVERLASHTILWFHDRLGMTVPDRAFDSIELASAFAIDVQHKISAHQI